MFSTGGNMGNSVVGKPVGMDTRAGRVTVNQIELRTLDDVLAHVRGERILMKMDVQVPLHQVPQGPRPPAELIAPVYPRRRATRCTL
eukprot:5802780-Prymnesium_polylepis.1